MNSLQASQRAVTDIDGRLQQGAGRPAEDMAQLQQVFQKRLEPQLILYSMCLSATDAEFKPERGIITYRNLRTGTMETISAGSDVKGTWKDFFGECKLDLKELIESFSKQWINRIERIELHERFYADSGHCGYCEFADVCRKDDVRFRDRIRSQESF